MQNKDIFLIGKKWKKLPKLRAGAEVIWAMPKIKGVFFWEGIPYLQENYIKSEW